MMQVVGDDYPDDYETEGLDPEGPSEDDLERFGEEFRPCPECGADVYDQVPLCPKCGHAFDDKAIGLPLWMVATACIIVVAMILIFTL